MQFSKVVKVSDPITIKNKTDRRVATNRIAEICSTSSMWLWVYMKK